MAGGVDTFSDKETGRLSYAGVHHCRSTAGCPVCRATKMAGWRATLEYYIEANRDRGGSEQLVTFTIPHKRTDDLKTLFRVVRRAVTRTFSGAGWKAIAKQFRYLGQAQVLETTWSPFAGYHPHVHALVFYASDARQGLAMFRLALLARYAAYVAQEAARAHLDIPPIDVDRILDIRHVEHAGQYVTKMGLADELTAPGSKVGKQVHGIYHLTMAQVGRRLAYTRLRYGEDGPTDRERDHRRYLSDKRTFLGYVGAMRGQQIFRIGRGLAAKINAQPLRSDVVPELSTMAGTPANELPADRESVYHFSPGEWSRFRAAGPLAQVELERRAEQDRASVTELRWFIDAVLARSWRPRRDQLWGEDADSPLFAPETAEGALD